MSYIIDVKINGINGQDDLYKIDIRTWYNVYSKPIIKQYGFDKWVKYTYIVLNHNNNKFKK